MSASVMTAKEPIQPGHRAIRRYYESVEALRRQRVFNEMNVRTAFETLLADAAKLKGWTLIPELSGKSGGALIRPDGTVRDRNSLPRGYWEAKDTQDDLSTEIKKKVARGYPLSNIIFEDTETGVLYQNRQQVNGQYNLGDPKELAALLNQFLSHTEPDIEGFDEAVEEFKERVPELARGLVDKIQQAHKNNPAFQAAFEKFFELCRTALNPNIRVEAVDEMLVQHLLTERLFRTVFNNPEFVKRNAIAAEVERVIDALVSHSFDRMEFLKGLDRFYVAIESAARTLPDFSEKQHFLNTVYERFFQGYSVKLADTMGIVYTPQPIVDFMCASVAEVLEKDFGKSLASPDVYIIDPCTGTGNFIVNLMRRMPQRDLPRVYREQLFANEVMLLPYYIAALNIEHAYFELTGEYEPFDGLCFVDTLDLAKGSQHQLGFMTEKNAERVERQRQAPITVVIGNPPYNMGQVNENDNNKNRKYEVTDRRIQQTYAASSKAALKNKLYDPYVKFFRWATDRLEGRDGIVCFVSNNSFIDQQAFDGMQENLLSDFTDVYHVDLHGNVRRNPKLSGTTHNVFGIQVGVGITVGIRLKGKGKHQLHYHRMAEDWRKERKLQWLAEKSTIGTVDWEVLQPNKWLTKGDTERYRGLVPLGLKGASSRPSVAQATDIIFNSYSLGVVTSRDEWAYDFSEQTLPQKVKLLVTNYNYEVFRYSQETVPPKDIDAFVNADPRFIKWTDRLKDALTNHQILKFDRSCIRHALYRPYTSKTLYFDQLLNQRRYQQHHIFPTQTTEHENRIIWAKSGMDWPFFVLAADRLVDLLPQGGSMCFPFYIYDEDGTNRRENITDWALEHFRKHYGDKKINKWDIFYYVYAVLHHPEYRSKYAENLKRELPRIPLATDFRGFAKAGKELADLHVGYEKVEPYPLTYVEEGAAVAAVYDRRNVEKKKGGDHRSPLQKPLSYRVEDKMQLAKDRTALKVNDTLTLSGIPPEAFEYRLGNRSAFEWVIDQYRVTEDKHSGIRSDPNRADDPEYIVRLVGQVIRVSLETVRIVNSLPAIEGS
jgi:predicted helicase